MNETHQSTTDPETRPMRSKDEAPKLSQQGHVRMDHSLRGSKR